jgi:mannose-6-phosphate isomerase-like protein (cupin superfamily)
MAIGLYVEYAGRSRFSNENLVAQQKSLKQINFSKLFYSNQTMHLFQQPRRGFLRTGIAGFCTAMFAGLSNIGFAKPVAETDKPIVVHKNEGIHILTGRRKVPITIKISKAQHGVDAISFCIEEQRPGSKMRIHKHLNNDEVIFIHGGEGTLTLGERAIAVKTGDIVFVPRGTWHGLDNTGKENLLMAFQYSPAGFEEYFIENGTLVGMPPKEKTEEEYAITEKKYGMVYKKANAAR